jgi:hypothetical protein
MISHALLASLVAARLTGPIIAPHPHMNHAAKVDAAHDAIEQPSYAWTQSSCMRTASQSPNMLFLGDSIFDGWSGYLIHEFPGAFIDAEVGRQFSAAIPIYRSLMRYQGIQNIQTIIVELGTNGAVAPSQISQFMALAGNRQVIFIAPKVDRSWGPEVDHLYAALPRYYPNVRVMDWQSISVDHPDYFWADGIHPNWRGIQAMVSHLKQMVAEEMVGDYPPS